MELNRNEKMRMLAELIRMAGADGEHRSEEYDFLQQVTETLKIDPIEMERLFNIQQQSPLPKSEMLRIFIFSHLVMMILADGEVSEDEIQLLKELTIKLALPPQAVQEVINRLHLYLNTGFPADEIIKIFQVHHN